MKPLAIGMPLGAYGPVRYTSSGTKMSFPCASTGPAAGPTASAAINSPINVFVVFMCSSSVTG
jgi:hypothetical protein